MKTYNVYPESTRQPQDVTSGVVWSEVLSETSAPPVMVNRTHFAPGARTCWHFHPSGQVLIVETGFALVQEEGEPARRIGPGGRVVCEPAVRHWHGAAPSSAMTQFAVTGSDSSGDYAVWEEQVTDDEYEAAAVAAA